MVGPKLDLWRRIQDFAIDEADAELAFTARLARENGWPLAFARRVVEEYRQFVFLAMVAEHEVTPSDEVDQAWHLHLVYTRSYWDELCGKVLGCPLHHGPTRGGRAEGERYDENYRRTLASYEKWFGEKPAADIWPRAEIRFGDGAEFVRVNTSRNWIINKRALRNAAVLGGLLGLSLTGLGAAGPLAANVPALVTAFTVVFLILLVAALIASLFSKSRRDSNGSGGGGCSGCGSWFGGCSSGSDGGGGCGGSGCGGGGCGGGCGGGD